MASQVVIENLGRQNFYTGILNPLSVLQLKAKYGNVWPQWAQSELDLDSSGKYAPFVVRVIVPDSDYEKYQILRPEAEDWYPSLVEQVRMVNGITRPFKIVDNTGVCVCSWDVNRIFNVPLNIGLFLEYLTEEEEAAAETTNSNGTVNNAGVAKAIPINDGEYGRTPMESVQYATPRLGETPHISTEIGNRCEEVMRKLMKERGISASELVNDPNSWATAISEILSTNNVKHFMNVVDFDPTLVPHFSRGLAGFMQNHPNQVEPMGCPYCNHASANQTAPTTPVPQMYKTTPMGHRFGDVPTGTQNQYGSDHDDDREDYYSSDDEDSHNDYLRGGSVNHRAGTKQVYGNSYMGHRMASSDQKSRDILEHICRCLGNGKFLKALLGDITAGYSSGINVEKLRRYTNDPTVDSEPRRSLAFQTDGRSTQILDLRKMAPITGDFKLNDGEKFASNFSDLIRGNKYMLKTLVALLNKGNGYVLLIPNDSVFTKQFASNLKRTLTEGGADTLSRKVIAFTAQNGHLTTLDGDVLTRAQSSNGAPLLKCKDHSSGAILFDGSAQFGDFSVRALVHSIKR